MAVASRRAWPRRAIALACPHAIVISSRTRPSAAWRATWLPLTGSTQADFGGWAWSTAAYTPLLGCSTSPASSRRLSDKTVDVRGRRPSRMRSARLELGLARITASKAWSDLAANRRRDARRFLLSPWAGTLAFGSPHLPTAPRAPDTMSGNEPARIRDAASAAVESDLRRAIMSDGSGSGMDRFPKEACCEL